MWILILIHLFLVFGGIFFLSPELTVYPYLVSKGLVPYQNLVDQHFPLVFFGPVNLSFFHLFSPTSTLLLFEGIIILTDFFAYLALRKHPLIFCTFILLQFLLGGNTFWVESLVLLCLTAYLYLNSLKPTWVTLVRGLFLSFAIGLRPTLLPFALILAALSARKKIQTLLLLSVFPLLEIIWLFYSQLWNSFMTMMDFNSTVYSQMAVHLPTKNDFIILVLALVPVIVIAHNAKKTLVALLLAALAIVLAYPRFDLTDLLPISAIAIYFAAKLTSQHRRILLIWLVLSLIFIFARRFRFQPTNYYYPPSIYQSATKISTIANGRQIYFFGGPDQLYVLTNSTPIGDYYLPSLPWYLSQSKFIDAEIDALSSNPDGLVVVNRESSLSGKSLLDYGQPIWSYIQKHYKKINSVGVLDIYEFKN